MKRKMMKVEGGNAPSSDISIWKRNLDKYSKEKGLEFAENAFYMVMTDNNGVIKTNDNEINSKYANPFTIENENLSKNSGVILVRVAMSDPDGNIGPNKKYIILQTYYNDGVMGTIDIVRLPKENGKDMIKEYLDNILTPKVSVEPSNLENIISKIFNSKIMTEEEKRKIMLWNMKGNSLDIETIKTRFLVAESSLDIEDNSENIYNPSTNTLYKPNEKLGGYDVDDIVLYLLSVPGSDEVPKNENEGKENGREYIEKCLNIMFKYQKTPDFYTKLLDLYIARNKSGKIITNPAIINSLIIMKSIDESLSAEKDKDLISYLIYEITNGLSKEIMMQKFTKLQV